MKGRKAIPADLKDVDVYKDPGAIERQKFLTPGTGASTRLKAPVWLSPGAKAEWKRIVALYKEADIIGILNDLDQAVMIAYTTEVDIRDTLIKAWNEERKIYSEEITESSKTKTSAGGGVETTDGKNKRRAINPLLREIERHNAMIRQLAEQLALTPAGRAAYAVRREKASRSAAEAFMDEE